MKSMLDLMFNLVIIFCLLFFLSFLQINVNKKKKAGIRPPAEILITVEWPDGMASDIDSWLLMPDDQIVFFQDQDKSICVLDRDDLGDFNNRVYLPNGEVIIDKTNKEITTIRTLAKGEYIFNIHWYNERSSGETSIPVKITVTKINPRVVDIFKRTITLTKVWQEETVCSITVRNDSFVDVVRSTYVPLVKRKLRRPPTGGM